jgi:hypothetical protein
LHLIAPVRSHKLFDTVDAVSLIYKKTRYFKALPFIATMTEQLHFGSGICAAGLEPLVLDKKALLVVQLGRHRLNILVNAREPPTPLRREQAHKLKGLLLRLDSHEPLEVVKPA